MSHLVQQPTDGVPARYSHELDDLQVSQSRSTDSRYDDEVSAAHSTTTSSQDYALRASEKSNTTLTAARHFRSYDTVHKPRNTNSTLSYPCSTLPRAVEIRAMSPLDQELLVSPLLGDQQLFAIIHRHHMHLRRIRRPRIAVRVTQT